MTVAYALTDGMVAVSGVVCAVHLLKAPRSTAATLAGLGLLSMGLAAVVGTARFALSLDLHSLHSALSGFSGMAGTLWIGAALLLCSFDQARLGAGLWPRLLIAAPVLVYGIVQVGGLAGMVGVALGAVGMIAGITGGVRLFRQGAQAAGGLSIAACALLIVTGLFVGSSDEALLGLARFHWFHIMVSIFVVSVWYVLRRTARPQT